MSLTLRRAARRFGGLNLDIAVDAARSEAQAAKVATQEAKVATREAKRAAQEAKRAAKQARSNADRASISLKELLKQFMTLRQTLDEVLQDRYVERFADLVAPAPYFAVHDDSREHLLSLLRRVGVSSRTFLDIGCGRSGGQSGVLARRFGWTGTFVDASPGVEQLRQRFGDLPGVHFRRLMVTPENVNELTELGEFDLLNIDIDSYDYWVWRALQASPRLVVIEYNSLLGDQPVVVPFGAIVEGTTPKGYSGASLAALEKLGREKGYLLLGCDRMGVNAYFGRADLLPAEAGLTAEQAWRPILKRRTTDDVPRSRENMELIEKAGLPFESV